MNIYKNIGYLNIGRLSITRSVIKVGVHPGREGQDAYTRDGYTGGAIHADVGCKSRYIGRSERSKQISESKLEQFGFVCMYRKMG